MKISGRREDKKTTAIIGRIRKDVGAYWGFAVVFVLYDIAAHAMFHAFCPSVFLFGLPCPGCGMTRAVFFFITGQFQRGMQMNPLGLMGCLSGGYAVWVWEKSERADDGCRRDCSADGRSLFVSNVLLLPRRAAD